MIECFVEFLGEILVKGKISFVFRVIFGLVFYRIEDVLRKRIRFDYIYEKLSLN